MGMFDRVHIECPHCNKRIGIPVYSGECRMLDIDDLKAIPSAIALELQSEEHWCDHCQSKLRFIPDIRPPATVRMFVVKDG